MAAEGVLDIVSEDERDAAPGIGDAKNDSKAKLDAWCLRHRGLRKAAESACVVPFPESLLLSNADATTPLIEEGDDDCERQRIALRYSHFQVRQSALTDSKCSESAASHQGSGEILKCSEE